MERDEGREEELGASSLEKVCWLLGGLFEHVPQKGAPGLEK